MITFIEVKKSPSGWIDATREEMEETAMSFESELTDLIYSYRNKVNKHYVSRALTGAADVVEKDEGWLYDETNIEPDEDEAPVLSAISPNTAELNAPDVTMTCRSACPNSASTRAWRRDRRSGWPWVRV